ncbi:hypothetical protein M8C21_032425, partial [Ambrosia artemisiifolia]
MPAARDGENGGVYPTDYYANKPCPAGVAQSRNDENGVSLTFTPVNPKKGVIRFSTDVNIKFSGSNSCNVSNVWRLNYDKGMKQYAVMLGGVEGNPGPKTLENWFKIEKTNDGYKLVFCPSVCSYCKVMCKDVGIVEDKDGEQRLVLSDDPASFSTFTRTCTGLCVWKWHASFITLKHSVHYKSKTISEYTDFHVPTIYKWQVKTGILLFSLAFILVANSVPAPVLDYNGKYVRTGVEYLVKPAALDGEYGGLYVADFFGEKPCPVGIAQSRDDADGLSLSFAPVNPKKGVIRLSTDVNIKFSGSNNCNESNIWKLEYDKSLKQYAVMVGGVEGNPGPETLENWFKIEKTDDGYKFVFCPSVCSYCKVMCRDVGIVLEEGGARRLALSNDPSKTWAPWESGTWMVLHLAPSMDRPRLLNTANAAPAPAPVLDMHGKPLRAGAEYIVIPLDGQDGGLYVRDIGKKSCSPGVVLSYNDEDGLPMTFTPVNPKKGVIRLSTDVNIKFLGSTTCDVSNIWRLKYDKGMKQYAVMAGGVEGNPGPETLDNWFKIEKSEKTNDAYKFVYCPSVCSYCKVTCSDVGIVEDKDGWRPFYLNHSPTLSNMKTIILLFSLSFIFTANSTPDPVLDAHGKIIRPGHKYRVKPAYSDDYIGGLILRHLGNESCPLAVGQDQGADKGLWLTFTPVNPKERVIRVSTDVNIKFLGSNSCNESNVWRLKYNEFMEQPIVMVGGDEGNPGPKTLDNWFKLEKSTYNAPAPAPVLDVNGKYLRAGAKYTVMSAQDSENGGFFPVLFNNKQCPAGVAQSRLEEDTLSLTFAPVNPKKGVIRLSTDLNIKFSGDTGCNESNVWKIKYDKAMEEYAVMVGGVEGKPGPKTLDNWFKIEKTSDGYKFVFCPSVCSYCKVMCRDVGIVEDENGWQRLALSNDALSLVFFPIHHDSAILLNMTTIILFSLSFAFIFTAYSAPAPPVLDYNGKYLRTGAKYYIMPAALDGEDGGLYVADYGKNPCPAGVAQSRNDENGVSLTFTPVNPKKGVIRVSTDVNIKFSGSNSCNESNVWKMKYDKGMKQYAVMLGGVEGNPGPKTLKNWFKIEKTNEGYKFVFCPSVCSYCNMRWQDVGIAVDEDGAKQMKTIILFSLALIILAANSAPTPAPVLDVNGKYLRTGADYILTPVDYGQHGGLYARDIGKKSCSPGVVLSYNDEDAYMMTFTPVNPKKGVIRLSTDVNIKFSGSAIPCDESNIWRLKYDKGMKKYAVMAGGVEGNPGPETLENWFKIEKTNEGYKFVYCPSVCSYCNVTCSDVGIVEDKDGWKRLALS